MRIVKCENLCESDEFPREIAKDLIRRRAQSICRPPCHLFSLANLPVLLKRNPANDADVQHNPGVDDDASINASATIEANFAENSLEKPNQTSTLAANSLTDVGASRVETEFPSDGPLCEKPFLNQLRKPLKSAANLGAMVGRCIAEEDASP